MDETWLYHDDPETKQQSMEWRHCDSPRPKKIPSAKIRWKSTRLDFLGTRRHPPHLLSSKGPNYQRRILIISVGAIQEHFEGEVTKGVLFLHDNAPAHQVLTTQKKVACLGFQCLDHTPYSPGSGPVGLPPVPWTEKAIENSPFFVRRGGYCCHGDLVGRTTY